MERIRLAYKAVSMDPKGITLLSAETEIPCHSRTLTLALAGDEPTIDFQAHIVEGLELAQLHDFIPGSLKVSKVDTPVPQGQDQDQDPETILKAIAPEMNRHHEARRKAEKSQARKSILRNLFPHF